MSINFLPIFPDSLPPFTYEDNGDIRNDKGNILLPQDFTSADTVVIHLSISQVNRVFYMYSLAWCGRYGFSRTPNLEKDMCSFKINEMTQLVKAIPIWGLQRHFAFLHLNTFSYVEYLRTTFDSRFYEDQCGNAFEMKEENVFSEDEYKKMVNKFAQKTLTYFQFVLHHLHNIPSKYPRISYKFIISDFVKEKIEKEIIPLCERILEGT